MVGVAGGTGVVARAEEQVTPPAGANTEESANASGLCVGSLTSGESARSGTPPTHFSMLSQSPDGLLRSIPSPLSELRNAVRSMSLPLSHPSIVVLAALSACAAATRRDADTAPKSAVTRCARLGVAATATAAAAAAAAVATAFATAAARDARSSSPPRLPTPPPLLFSVLSVSTILFPSHTSAHSVRTAAGVAGNGNAIAIGAGGADATGARQIDARGASEARGAG